MENCNENGTAKEENSLKSKQKKKSLCQILMNKKTKVGCLEASQKDSEQQQQQQQQQRSSKMENSHHSSNTSTKLSLCCAMTERSRTPPQSLTVSRLSPTLSRTSMKSEEIVPLQEENYQTEALIENGASSRAISTPVNSECFTRRNKPILNKDRHSACIEGEFFFKFLFLNQFTN